MTLNGTGVSGGGALRNVSGNNSWAANITLGSESRINSDAGTLTLAGTISSTNTNMTVGGAGNTSISSALSLGSGALTKDGSGVLTLSGANSYSGGTTISGGTLRTGAINTLSATSPVSLADTAGVVLDLNGYNQTIAGLSGGGTSGGNVTLGSGNLTVDTALSSTYEGVISGTGRLIKSGSGTLTLAGASSYTGTTTVTAGALNIRNASALGTTAGGTTVSSGAALEIQGGIAVAGEALTLNGTGVSNGGALRSISGANSWGGTITLASSPYIASDAGTLAVSGDISGVGYTLTAGGSGDIELSGDVGTGALTKVGDGMVVLSGANSISGATSVSAGVLNIRSATALGATFSGTTVASGAALEIQGGIAVVGEGLSLNGNGILDGGALRNVSGINSMSGPVTLVSASRINSDAGTLTLAGTISGGNNLTVGGAGNITLAGSLNTGTGTLTKDGGGSLTLSGPNGYRGTTEVSSGVLNIRSTTALGTTASGTTVLSGAALEIQGGIAVGAEALTLNGTGIANGGALRNVSGTNSMSGAITLAGVTRINSDAGTLSLSGGISSSWYNLTVGGAGDVTLSGGLNIGGGILTKNGSGTLTLDGISSHTGVTSVADGVLNVRNGLALGGTGGGTVVASGAALELQGSITVAGEPLSLSGTGISSGGALRNVSGNNVMGGYISLASNALIVSDAGELTLRGGIIGASSASPAGLTVGGAGNTIVASIIGANLTGLTKTGTGTLELSDANTYTGPTTITGGTLALTGTGSIAGSGSVQLTAGALDISGTTAGATIHTLSGATGTLALGARTLSVSQDSAGLFAGNIAGRGTLAKTGAGELELVGDGSAFTGTVQVSAGTLNLNDAGGTATGRLGGNVQVASGATLLGLGGRIDGTVTIASGGTLLRDATDPGANGLVMGALVLNAGATMDVSLATPSISPGVFTTTGNASLNGTLNITDLPGYGVGVYRIMSVAGAITDNGLTLGTPQFGTLVNTLNVGLRTLDVQVTAADTSLQYWSADVSTQGGSGTWTATNDWLNAGGGTSAWGSGTGVFAGTAGTVSVSGARSFDTLEFLTSGYVVTAGAAGSLDLGTGGRLWAEGAATSATVSAPITGTGALTKIGAGTIILAGTNSYFGGTVLEAGTLQVSSDANLGATTGGLTFTGGALTTTASFTSARDVVLSRTGRFNAATGTTLTLNGTLSGAGGLTKDGSGTLTLTGTNTYSGTTTIASGVTNIRNATALGSTADGTSVAAGAALEIQGGITVGAEALTLNGTGIANGGALRNVSGTNSFGGAIALSRNSRIISDAGALGLSGGISGTGTELTVGGAGNVTVSGNFAFGSGALVKVGTGTLTLSAANIYTGTTDITAGTLALSGNSSIEPSSSVIVNGTLDISATTTGTTINNLSGSTGTVALGSRTLTVNQMAGATFAGSITGSGTLLKTGGATLGLSGDSSAYTGTVKLAGGVLSIDGPSGRLGGDVSVASGARLQGLGGTIDGTVTVASGGTLRRDVTSTGTTALTMGTLMLEAGAIIDVSLGAPATSPSVFHTTGNATVDGTLNIMALPGYGVGVYRILSVGGTLTDNGLTLGTSRIDGLANAIEVGRQTLDVQVTAADTTMQYWSADGSKRGGSGTWSGTNDWLNAGGGTSAWGSEIGVFAGTAGTVTVKGVQSFDTLEFLTSGYVVRAGASGSLDLGTGGRLWAEGAATGATVSAPITGTGALTKIGAGTIILSGTNSYSGGTLLAVGTLQVSSDANLGAASGDLTFTGGTLATTASFTSARDALFFGNGHIDTATGTTLTLGGTLSGAGGLTKDGAGTLTLTGANTYGDTTTISSGVASIRHATALGSTAGGTSVASGAALEIQGGIAVGAEALTLNGTGISNGGALRNVSGTNSWLGNINLASDTRINSDAGRLGLSGGISGTDTDLAVGGDGNTVISGAIATGSGALIKDGSGTLTLTGASTYGGATSIIGGTLRAGAANALSPGSQLALADTAGATLDLDGYDQTVAGLAGGGTTGGNVSLGSATLTVATGSTSFAYAGAISGAGGLAKEGSGTLILAGDSSYTGGTSVTGGVLALAGSTAAGTGAITVEGATLGLGNGLTLANAVVLDGNTTFSLASGSATLSGTLSGSGNTRFTGDGIVSITGNSAAFSGTTNVTGTLAVNGTLGGAVNVGNGGMLMGNGMVGPTTLAAGATVAPGNSIGTLSVAGPLAFDEGATYAVEIAPTGLSDRLIVSGSATLNGADVAVAKASGIYLPDTHHTILRASGGVVGAFGALTQDMPFVDLKLSYDADSVALDVARNAVSFTTAAETENQYSVATAAELLGVGNSVYDALASQASMGETRRALNALDGEIYSSGLAALQGEALLLRRTVLDRARSPLEDRMSGAPASGAVPAAGDSKSADDAFWTQAFASWATYSGDGNAAELSGNSGGVLLGYDHTFDAAGGNWRLGLAGGYSSSRYTVDARPSSYDSDNIHLALYGSAEFGPASLRYGGAYSWYDVDTRRTVAFPGFDDSLSGGTNAHAGQLFGEAAYAINVSHAVIEPFAGLAYVDVDMDGFTEKGGAAALTSSGASQGLTYSTLGARFGLPLAIEGMTTAFRGTIAWQHAFGDTRPGATLGFAGASGRFDVWGTPIAADTILLEAGLDFAITSTATFSTSYTGQLSEENSNHALQGRLKINF